MILTRSDSLVLNHFGVIPYCCVGTKTNSAVNCLDGNFIYSIHIRDEASESSRIVIGSCGG